MNGRKLIKTKRWFIDKDSIHRWIYHRIKKYVVSTQTRFQKVELIDTYDLGRIVVVDNRIQSAEADEFIYHEVLVHPSMITHPNPKVVLILGGGEGATLREVLKYPSVKKVVMVDIDEEFVNLCKRFLKNWHHNSFNDKRVELIFADANDYIKKIKSFFDVVITDITDPVERGPAQELYTRKFYLSVGKALMPDGIFVTHAAGVFYTAQKCIYMKILEKLADIFPLTNFYYDYIPSFSSLWGFAIGSNKYRPEDISSIAIQKRLKKRGLDNLSYYDQKTHSRLFGLPKSLRRSGG